MIMLVQNIIVIIISIYLVISIIVFFLINSNIIPFRRYAGYNISIPVKQKYFDNGETVYWEGIQTKEDKNVILLHGFTRNSGAMDKRAKIYWELGYNIYFIDNRGHGKSKFKLFPSGYQYSWVVRSFIREKNIKSTILHGASMGGIASAYVAQKEPNLCKMIICEALPHDFDNLYMEIMNYMKIPTKVFFWMNWISRKIVWRQFDPEDAYYDLSDITCPMFVIHGEMDKMFLPDTHFKKVTSLMSDRDNFRSWFVEGSKHTHMDRNSDYKKKLTEFITEFN